MICSLAPHPGGLLKDPHMDGEIEDRAEISEPPAQPTDDSVDAAPPILVVGCGNWQVRPDRIGPRVLARLAERGPAGVELGDVGTTLLGLLDRLHGQDLLVLVDACIGRAAPGTVEVVDADREIAVPPRATLHQIGPLETLAIARELYPERCPQRTRLVMIETRDLDPQLEDELCARALAAIESEIASEQARRPPPSSS